MKISKDVQKNILLESFEVLKTDYDEYYEEIIETIGKMSVIDLDTAMDMWEHMLDLYPSVISSDNWNLYNSYIRGLTCGVLSTLCERVGKNRVANSIKTRPKIKDAIFSKSSYIDYDQCLIIAEYISHGEIEVANEALGLVNANKYNSGKGSSLSLGGVLQKIIDELESDASESSVEFLHYWIQQIMDVKDRAKANVRFLDLFIKK